MKKLLLLLAILSLVSCGKKSSPDSSSTTNKETNELKQLDLSGQTFNQTTLNGVSQLYFSDAKKGTIEVFLHSTINQQCSVEEEKSAGKITVSFNFKEYRYIEQDIIELTNISIGSKFFVGDCGVCNSRDTLPWIIKDYEKYCYDLLNNKETIRVKILNINDKKHFYLIDFGNQRML